MGMSGVDAVLRVGMDAIHLPRAQSDLDGKLGRPGSIKGNDTARGILPRGHDTVSMNRRAARQRRETKHRRVDIAGHHVPFSQRRHPQEASPGQATRARHPQTILSAWAAVL